MRTLNQLLLELKSLTDIHDKQMRKEASLAWYEALSDEEKTLLNIWTIDAVNRLSLAFGILSKAIMVAVQGISRAFQSSAWQNVLGSFEEDDND